MVECVVLETAWRQKAVTLVLAQVIFLVGSHRDVTLGLTRVPSDKRLLNGPVTSVRYRLAFVLKEPIRCYVNVGNSVL